MKSQIFKILRRFPNSYNKLFPIIQRAVLSWEMFI